MRLSPYYYVTVLRLLRNPGSSVCKVGYYDLTGVRFPTHANILYFPSRPCLKYNQSYIKYVLRLKRPGRIVDHIGVYCFVGYLYTPHTLNGAVFIHRGNLNLKLSHMCCSKLDRSMRQDARTGWIWPNHWQETVWDMAHYCMKRWENRIVELEIKNAFWHESLQFDSKMAAWSFAPRCWCYRGSKWNYVLLSVPNVWQFIQQDILLAATGARLQ